VATVGGASGPLYGTAFIEAGFRAGETAELGPELIGDMLVAAADGLARRGRCTLGDKTILDTLRPAAEAYRARGCGRWVRFDRRRGRDSPPRGPAYGPPDRSSRSADWPSGSASAPRAILGSWRGVLPRDPRRAGRR